MRFMIIVKATRETEAGGMPTEQKFNEMTRFHEELQKAGLLVDASGLKATSKGWRIRYNGQQRTVTDGPFTETKELMAGYTIIKTKSREEALEWTRRFPNPDLQDGQAEIEVRQIFDLDDFEQNEAAQSFRDMNLPSTRSN